MIEEMASFSSENLILEGVLTYQEAKGGRLPGVVLCSPHPQLGGSMDNNVIQSVAKSLAQSDFVTLRFNYRGVGNSTLDNPEELPLYEYWERLAQSGDYTGIVNDVKEAIAFLKSVPFVQRNALFLVGYSFGALMGIRAMVDEKALRALVAISAPLTEKDPPFLQCCSIPLLFIYGDDDLAFPPKRGINLFHELFQRGNLEVIPQCDHFYIGKEELVAQKVRAFLSSLPIAG